MLHQGSSQFFSQNQILACPGSGKSLTGATTLASEAQSPNRASCLQRPSYLLAWSATQA
jgi:hypothetical protein